MKPEREVGARLRDTAVPGADAARARARRVVLAAAAERAAAPRRARRPTLALAAAAVAALALAGALATPPGEAVGHWVRELIRLERPLPPPRPALTELPAAGRLLVTGPAGAWVVQRDGSRRRLGPYRDAAWSPRGLFVAVTRDRQLLAVEPGGAVRWALARPAPVADPRWSSDGYRIAYRTRGALRVVAGDGSGDRPLVEAVAAVPAAWRPGTHHRELVRDAGGALELWSPDRGRRLWRRARGPGTPVALAWTPDGRRLVEVRPDAVSVFGRRGRLLRRVPLRRPALAAALSPDGRRLAVAGDRGVELRRLRDLRRGRPLLPVRASGGLAWAPAGHHLLVAAGGADQWVFLPVGRSGRVVASGGIARQFDPSRPRPRGFPRVEGWAP